MKLKIFLVSSLAATTILLAGCATQSHTQTTVPVQKAAAVTTQPIIAPVDVKKIEPGFHFTFRYGVNARNELDTFQNTYTKDLITSGTVTVPFQLTPAELKSVQEKITELDLFKQTITKSDTLIAQYPCSSYWLSVELDGVKQNLNWDQCTGTMTPTNQSFADFMTQLIENHPEYKALPEATGGYL